MVFSNRLLTALLCAAIGFSMLVSTAPQAKAVKYATPTVLLYGDSLAAESARYVRAELTRNGRAKMVDRTYPGSSPCDWHPAMKLDLSRGVPSGVILETFGNNISSCQKHNGVRAKSGSAEYWQQYKVDINALLDRLPSSVPVWLTAPPAARNDRSGGVSHKARMLALMQQIAAERPNTFAVDAGRAVETSDGGYAVSMRCLPGEECADYLSPGMNRTHAYDGLHFCPAIRSATIALLRNCPVYASGAWRFGVAQAQPVVQYLGL